MKVWTIIDEAQLTTLLKEGQLYCDENNTDVMLGEKEIFELPYKYMSEKLAEKEKPPSKYGLCKTFLKWILHKPYKCLFPRWVWYRIDGKDDLCLSNLAHYHDGKPGWYVLVVFNIPDEHVLLSDFFAWHAPLNRWFFADDERIDNDFTSLCEERNIKQYSLFDDKYISTLDEHKRRWADALREMIIKSWNKIFDIENESEYSRYKNNEKTIQGVVWKLYKKDIVSIKHFFLTQRDIDNYEKNYS